MMNAVKSNRCSRAVRVVVIVVIVQLIEENVGWVVRECGDE
jgi:hypothetical protein